ncbi:hypothetical protein ACIBEH_33220 [Nocardia salmonicida]|uniref:hypothetical protein n=1 Tax=Nocardia salmonicida TaxID=53431 RepID=UPI003794491E
MTSTVLFASHGWTWHFGGLKRKSNGADGIVMKHSDLEAVRATDLVRELRRASGDEDESEHILVDYDQSTSYYPKSTIVEPISFQLIGNRLAVRLSVLTDDRVDDDQLLSRVDNAIRPLLQQLRFTLIEAVADPYSDTAPFAHIVYFSTPTRGKTLQDIYTAAEQISALFDAAETGVLRRDTAWTLTSRGFAIGWSRVAPKAISPSSRPGTTTAPRYWTRGWLRRDRPSPITSS